MKETGFPQAIESPIEQESVFLPEYSHEEILNLEKTIDQFIEKGEQKLDFGPHLEKLYLKEDSENRRKAVFIGGIFALVLYDLFLIVDKNVLTNVFQIALIVRLGIFTPIALLFILFSDTRVNFIFRDLFKILITLGAAVTFIYLSSISRNRDAVFYFPVLILIVAYGNVFLRIRFIGACISSSILFFLFLFFFPIDPKFPPQVLITNILFLLAGIAITLVANHYIEQEARSIFLYSTKERIRQRLLEDDNEYLTELSTTDALTGLANRREVNNYLQNLSQMRPEIMTIIMLDIDYFKNFNDHYGHAAGDSCLRQIAGILMNSVRRKRDLVGRFGGEEFIILLPDTGLENGIQITGSIMQEVEKASIPHVESPVKPFVTISFGIACGEVAVSGNVERILKSADLALYQAKDAGRNQISSTDLRSS